MPERPAAASPASRRPLLLRPQLLRVLAGAVLVLGVGHPFAAAGAAPLSGHSMAEAIARSGAFAFEECPPSAVDEHSPPGCAQIPAPLSTAQRWLDLMEEAVFLETTRLGAWTSERSLAYVVWRLEPTGQRYLLVLAPHPHTEVTILYVSELAPDVPVAGGTATEPAAAAD